THAPVHHAETIRPGIFFMMRFRQSGAVRWLALALAATGSAALLGAGLTWSAAPTLSLATHAVHATAAAGGLSASPHGVIDFTPDGTQPGLQAAIESPESCFSCHRSFNPGDTSKEFMPHNTWAGSM